MRNVGIKTLPDDELKQRINGLTEFQQEQYNEALKLLKIEDEATMIEAKHRLLWLDSVGKELLKEQPKNSESVNELSKVVRKFTNAKYSIQNLPYKALHYFKKELPISFEEIETILDEAIKASHKANSNIQTQVKNSYLTDGLSLKDEFIGFCLGAFNQYHPNTATKTEFGAFDSFCQHMMNMVLDVETKSHMGSIRKILK